LKIAEHIQTTIHALEVGKFSRRLQLLPLALAVVALAVVYDLTSYHGFSSPEAMDAAQVGRNLAEGRGFTTQFIRPFSAYLVQKHNRELHFGELQVTNGLDFAQLEKMHPDLANAPVYPVVLAGLFKLASPDRAFETLKPFWSRNGKFLRYPPEFFIAVFNQLLLVAVVALTFLIARRLFDPTTAWLAAILTLGSEVLWRFSVSGQSTMLLLVIFLSLVLCLMRAEELGSAAPPNGRRLFLLAFAAGALAGLGLLTRYGFGWIIVPVVVFLAWFGGQRRAGLAVTAFLAFALVAIPWILRNQAVSGTWFGTAGYAVVEGSAVFPGAKLMQSTNPNLTDYEFGAVRYAGSKLVHNASNLLQGDLLHLGSGWLIALFFVGFLLGVRTSGARRLRYFTLMGLGLFLVVQALGQTQLSAISPEINSENLLVLMTPLVVIFGVAGFTALLERMDAPSLDVRLAAVMIFAVLCCQPLASNIVVARPSPIAYPPYYPPEIRKISGWLQPDELMMSDIPWAVAWYGDRQCAWTTVNAKFEFNEFDIYYKHVSGLYLTLMTLDKKLFTECLQGGVASWENFVLKSVSANQIPPQFPLRVAPYGLITGLFLTDRVRWETE
jgi:hypothetical protein